MFKIEDERHAEWQPEEYVTLSDVLAQLRRLAAIPWNESPNVAPCTNWANCGRFYEIAEYDVTAHPWKELRRIPALEISAQGVKWHVHAQDS